jgi:hypothetical protein
MTLGPNTDPGGRHEDPATEAIREAFAAQPLGGVVMSGSVERPTTAPSLHNLGPAGKQDG